MSISNFEEIAALVSLARNDIINFLPFSVLHTPQAGVQPTSSNQIIVVSMLSKLTAFEDENPVSVVDSGEAVGDDNRGAIYDDFLQRALAGVNFMHMAKFSCRMARSL